MHVAHPAARHPRDFVIATGEMHTVREFATLAFREVGITLCWEGQGVDEKGIDTQTGKVLVEVDPKYFRPAESGTIAGRPHQSKNTAGMGIRGRPVFERVGTHHGRARHEICEETVFKKQRALNELLNFQTTMLDKNAKIYVAGHRGLVGSAIWKNLEEKGYTNLIGKTHTELDLLDGVAVRRFFDEEQPEYVFLAAAFVGGIMANSIYRADFIYKNLQIQQNVIGESFRHGVKKLLFLGSTCIYPRDAEQPMKEDALLTSPLEYTNDVLMPLTPNRSRN